MTDQALRRPVLKHGSRLQNESNTYDVFLAAPMSGFDTEAAYQASRNEIMSLIKHMRHVLGVEKIYYAGENVSSQSAFSAHAPALQQDMMALRGASSFILIYPARAVSSALIEAGVALALMKPMLILVRNRKDLPFLFYDAEGIPDSSLLPPLCIVEYGDISDLATAVGRELPKLLRRATRNI